MIKDIIRPFEHIVSLKHIKSYARINMYKIVNDNTILIVQFYRKPCLI